MKQATSTNATPHLVFLSFKATGTWMYGLSHSAQQQIKRLMAGKSIDEAKSLLQHVPGIQHTGIQLAGLTDRISKNPDLIHLVFLSQTA